MIEPIRVLIVDDERLARDGLRHLVGSDPELEVVGECGDGAAAVEAIERLDPDLVFLDVQMPNIDGMSVVRQIGPDRMPPVVFVTAFDRHAVDAFEVHAVDYLLKPFEDARFYAAVGRAKEIIKAGATATSPTLSTIAVRKADRTVFVPVESIDWIEAADYCVKLHASGRTHVIREAMHRLEQRLDHRFFRTHRSAIVRLDRVRELTASATGDSLLLLADGSQIKLSRVRRAALEARLGQPL